jgi:hypothetical protein
VIISGTEVNGAACGEPAQGCWNHISHSSRLPSPRRSPNSPRVVGSMSESPCHAVTISGFFSKSAKFFQTLMAPSSEKGEMRHVTLCPALPSWVSDPAWRLALALPGAACRVQLQRFGHLYCDSGSRFPPGKKKSGHGRLMPSYLQG